MGLANSMSAEKWTEKAKEEEKQDKIERGGFR